MKLKRNIVANFIGQGWSALVGIAFLPLYIQYLGISAYGLIGFFITLQAILSFLDLGFSQTLNREMARFKAGKYSAISIKKLLRSIEILLIFVAIFIFFLVWGLSDFIAFNWLSSAKLQPNIIASAVVIMGAIIGLKPIEQIYFRSLFGLERQVVANIIMSLSSLVRFGGSLLALIFIENSIVIFFLWQLASSIFFLLILMFFTYFFLPQTKEKIMIAFYPIKNVWKFSIGICGITILAIMMTQFDKIILSSLLSLELFGYYSLAWTIASATMLISLPISQAYYPKLVDRIATENKNDFNKLFHQGSQMIVILAGSLVGIIFFFSDNLIYLWTGDFNLATKISPILRPLIIGCFLNYLVWMPYQAQLAYGWTRFGLWANLIAVLFILPSIYIVTPIYGEVGAAWIWVSLNLGYITLGMHFMYKKILQTEKKDWYIQDIIKPTIYIILVILFFKFMVFNSLESNTVKVIFYLAVWVISMVFTIFMIPTLKPIFINMFLFLWKKNV